MSSQNNKLDLEMLRKYKETKNDEFALYFYKKFSKDLVNIVFSKINSKFSSIPLERNDLLSMIWKGIKQTLDEYDESKDYSLFSGFVQKSYQKSLREALRFLTNGHIVLNNASSLEEVVYSNIKTRDGVVYQQLKFEDLQNELIIKLTKQLSKYDPNKIKRFIYLKSLGYSIKEISKKMRLTYNEVKNLIYVIKRIGKNYYKN